MILNNLYCQASGMVMQCINDLNLDRLPVVVELGCADGEGVARYGGFCDKIICVDPMVSNRPDIESYKLENLACDEGKVKKFESNTSHIVNHVTLIKGCSAWEESIEAVKKELDGNMIDVLLIDGVHHPFEAVWKDFELYYPLVDEGGFIILDDLYESCIEKVWTIAQDDYGCIEHDRKKLTGKYRTTPNILQDVGALQVKNKVVV